MSSFLAVAAVTALLHRIIQNAVVADVNGATVTTGRPDKTAGAAPAPTVNIYLLRATPNPAWANADLPTRDSDGYATARPRAALDLHYLFTFNGEESKLEPQRLLGSVVNALHTQPTLTHTTIASNLQQIPNTDLDYTIINDSGLADEIELVKFVPASLSLDELSKVWSVFFQTPYSLTIAYDASVVFIEGRVTPRSAPPVRDRDVRVVSIRQPVIQTVMSLSGTDEPILSNSTLLIVGKYMRGDPTWVRAFGRDVEPQDISDTRITVPLSAFPASSIRAGVQGVQVVQPVLFGTPPVKHGGFESNVSPFVLHPTMDKAVQFAKNPASGGKPASVDITVTGIKPQVRMSQRVVVLLNEDTAVDPESYALPADSPSGDVSTITANGIGIKDGTYFVRIQVDGAESQLTFDDTKDPLVKIQ